MENSFLSDLFDGQEGIVYAPVKDGGWRQYFFEWPRERIQLEAHLNDFNKRDVYISPVLFNDKRISPETFKGTNYLWTEFDGQVPTDVIEPTMRVMSSQEGHEHWYWKLDSFQTDKVLVEDLTRRIAYHYGADLSVWDYQNVLRPVDTWNHKRNRPVTLVSKTNQIYSVNDFLWVPIPAAGTKVSVSLDGLPTRDAILAKYKWSYDALDLLFKEVEKGKRSDALARLAYELIESGASNDETYVLLEWKDSDWGKFVGRDDRHKQLEKLIANVRSKKGIRAEILQGATDVYRFHDFMRTDIHLKWAIDGLLPVAGSMVIFGKPGVGKSTFSLRMAMALALGEEYFLSWKIINAQKTLFVSLEMQHGELKEFFKDMNLSEEEQERLQDQFYIWPIGHAYPFDTPDQQLELLKYVKMHKIELVVIDSHSLAMYGSVKDDDDVKRLNSFLNEDLRKDLKCGYVFIHHPRKQGTESSKKVLDGDDSFGSMYITANAQTVLVLSAKPGSTRLHLKFEKTRMMQGPKEIDVERTPDRGFKLVGEISTPTASVGGETSSVKEPDAHSLGKLFGL
jgi:hypothetical protein